MRSVETHIVLKEKLRNNVQIWDAGVTKEVVQVSSLQRNDTTVLQQAVEIQTETINDVVQTTNRNILEILDVNQHNHDALLQQYSSLNTNFVSLSTRIENVMREHTVRVENLEQTLTSTNNNLQDLTKILAESQEQTLAIIQSQLSTPVWLSIGLFGGVVILGGLLIFRRISALERIVAETTVSTPQVEQVILPTAAQSDWRTSVLTFAGGLFAGVSFLKFFKK